MAGNEMLRIAIEGNLQEFYAKYSTAFYKGSCLGIQEVSEDLKTKLRNQVSHAGLGKGLANSWRSDFFKESRYGKPDPAATVYAKGKLSKRIMEAFEGGATIRAKNGTYLAIPTKNARRYWGTRGSASYKSANRRAGERFERKYFRPWDFEGQLTFLTRGGGKGVMVVRERKEYKRRGKKNAGKVRIAYKNRVMFYLVKQVHLRKRLNWVREMYRAEERLERVVAEKILQLDQGE